MRTDDSHRVIADLSDGDEAECLEREGKSDLRPFLSFGTGELRDSARMSARSQLLSRIRILISLKGVVLEFQLLHLLLAFGISARPQLTGTLTPLLLFSGTDVDQATFHWQTTL